MAIGQVSIFFGHKAGSLSFDRLLTTFGLEEMPTGNKTERLAYTLRYLLENKRQQVPDFINMLISQHKLGEEDLGELNSYLVQIGLMVHGKQVKKPPLERDFFKIFEESLRHPEPKPPEGGATDGAIITLSEKLMGTTSAFVLVDYGCGQGRLVSGLELLDPKVLSFMTYIGIDKNPEYLTKIRSVISSSGFDRKIQRFELLTPEQFFVSNQRADFVFMINVLHEIALTDLPHVLSQLEKSLREGGHLIIHEMQELAEGELGFVSWKSEDFLEVFKDTNLQIQLHPYKTRTAVSLINVHLTRIGKEAPELFFVDNCFDMFRRKLIRIDQDIGETKKNNKASIEYAYLLILKDNMETQIRDYEKKEEALKSSSDIVKCPSCESRRLEKGYESYEDAWENVAVFRTICLRCGWKYVHDFAQNPKNYG